VTSFAKPIDRTLGANPQTYALQSYTHIYQQGYGSPEVDQTTPRVTEARVSADGLGVNITVEGLVQGHVHDFDLQRLRSATPAIRQGRTAVAHQSLLHAE